MKYDDSEDPQDVERTNLGSKTYDNANIKGKDFLFGYEGQEASSTKIAIAVRDVLLTQFFECIENLPKL